MINLRHNNRGSILIWTTLLGVMLASTFFFFATRLGMISGVQQNTLEYQNKKAFFNSYVEYLKKNPSDIDANYEGIDVELTNDFDEVTGVLDAGEEKEFKFSAANNVTIEWNLCGNGENGDMEHIDTSTKYPYSGTCTSTYGNSTNISSPITIKSLNSPFHYRITPDTSITVEGDWHLNAKMSVGFGKKIEVEEVF